MPGKRELKLLKNWVLWAGETALKVKCWLSMHDNWSLDSLACGNSMPIIPVLLNSERRKPEPQQAI